MCLFCSRDACKPVVSSSSGESRREEASEGGPGLQPSAVPQLPQSLLLRLIMSSAPLVKTHFVHFVIRIFRSAPSSSDCVKPQTPLSQQRTGFCSNRTAGFTSQQVLETRTGSVLAESSGPSAEVTGDKPDFYFPQESVTEPLLNVGVKLKHFGFS